MFKKIYAALILLIIFCMALITGLMVLFYLNKISFFDSNPYGYILDVRTLSNGFLVAAIISLLLLSTFLYFKIREIAPIASLITILIIGLLFIISSIIIFLKFNLAFKESYSFYSGALFSSIVLTIVVGTYLLRKQQLTLMTKLFGLLMLLSFLTLSMLAILELNNVSLLKIINQSISSDLVKSTQANRTIMEQGYVSSPGNESTEGDWIVWDKSIVKDLNKYGYASIENLNIISNKMRKYNKHCPKEVKRLVKRGSILQIVFICGILDKQYRIDTILNKSICCEKLY